MKKIKLYLNHAGHCIAKENDAIQNGRKMKIKFHALWGLIEHPDKGYILYDTGYTQRFYNATKSFPNKIYALATKVKITEDEEIVYQLKRHGIKPEEIRHIIITHFHADHIGGLADFPNATLYTSSVALNHTEKLSSFFAFSKGVLKDLLPPKYTKRTNCIDKTCTKLHDSIFGYKYDLFGDESIFIYDLPGHAAGQIGIFIQTDKKSYFLISDACWLKCSYENNILPNKIVKLFFHSWTDFKQTLNKVHLFHLKNPEVQIVPSHCAETTYKLIQPTIQFDVL
jgi:glyoxylase-like metal-dependent hydrolase (beta-lactamase superfamily II)